MNLKPTHKAIKTFHTAPGAYHGRDVIDELVVKTACQTMLTNLHLNEDAPETKLEWLIATGKGLDCRVEKMRVNEDKTELEVNDTLTLCRASY